MMSKTIKVSIYINEADQWQHRPLYVEILQMLLENGVAGGTVLRAIAGFTQQTAIQTATLVDVGSKLPLVIQFIDTLERVETVLPELRRMSGSRLIIHEDVQIFD